MNTFTHHTNILPSEQVRLWPELHGASKIGFTLYGGTAIALRLGHRQSVDFDFFSERPLDRQMILDALPFLARSETIQDRKNTWSVIWGAEGSGARGVKVSFFGSLAFGRVGCPEITKDGVLQVASLDDLMATKLKVIMQRAEAKDYRDIAAMIDSGVSLARGLASARLLYGANFQPMASLKALTYFNDGNLKTLRENEKNTLKKAAESVDKLPAVELLSRSLSEVPLPEPKPKPKPSFPRMGM